MRLSTRRTAALAVVSLAGALGLAGCGSDTTSTAKPESEHSAEHESEHEGEHETVDGPTTEKCLADATQVSSIPDGFPKDFPFPGGTVVYDVEDRGQDGVIATGVTDLAFAQVLAALNGPAQKAGFKITNGETEEHDAEANWGGNGFEGRWAIRESGSCQGETVVQVLARAE